MNKKEDNEIVKRYALSLLKEDIGRENTSQSTRLAVDIYLRRYKSDLKVDKHRIMQDISTYIQQQSDIPNWQKITIQPYGDTLTNQSSVLEIVISAPQGTNPSNVEQAITDSIEGEYRYDVYQY